MSQEVVNFSIIPVLFRIWGFSVNSHDFFALLALIFGASIYFYYARKYRFQNERVFIIIIAALFGWAIGSRLPLIIAYAPQIFRTDFNPTMLLNGKTIVWGLIGGTLTVWITKKILWLKWRFWNAIAPAAALGIAIWRIGCFLGSDAVGTSTSLPWWVDFWDHILRHPTQLYESFFCAFLFIYCVIRLQKPEKLTDGKLFTFFIVSYFIFRFLVEFIRIEPKLYLNLSAYQYAALGVILYQTFLFFYRKKQPIS